MPSALPTTGRRAATAALAALAIVAAAGCVERKMVLRSDPSGAMISLDGEPTELRTPAEIPFDWGGTRAVTLTAPGFKVLDAKATLADPWFTYFPLDALAEFVWPLTIHDTQSFDFKLEPYYPVEKHLTPELESELKKRLSEVKLRAEEYRAGGSEGPGKVAAPPPAPAAPPSPPVKPKR